MNRKKKKIWGLWMAIFFTLMIPYALSYAESKSESRTLHVHVKIEPIFLVDVTPRYGGDTVEFGTIKRAEGEKVKTEPVQVDISVLSNLGVPYQVSQTATQVLTSEEGTKLPLENLNVRASEAVHGVGKIQTPEPVTPKEQLLFESSPKGESDQFTADYSLQIPPTQLGGNYRTDIVYTIATKD